MTHAFAPEFDVEFYRLVYPDLAEMDPLSLRRHYLQYGIAEGRTASRAAKRAGFLEQIPTMGAALEIGPFFCPCLRGSKVKYFDVFETEELKRRAAAIGRNPANVPEINYVSSDNDLTIIEERFDVVFSSHSIEHQPDFLCHLNQVSDLLSPGGYYFLLIPDCRYCFDHFRTPSTIADVLDAYLRKRRKHDPRNILEHRLLSVHNDAGRHWAGDHGRMVIDDNALEIFPSLEEASRYADYYIDCHAWFFTPDALRKIMSYLRLVNLSKLSITRIYDTPKDSNEFGAILSLEI